MKKILLVLLALSLPAFAENVSNYMEQGGATWVVGGTLNVTGTHKISGSTVSTTSAELNQLAGSGASYASMVKIAALGTTDTGGGVLSFANPYSAYPIRVTRLDLNVETGATASNTTLDCGVGGATTSNDTLLDGVDVSASRYLSSVYDSTNGTNGSLVVRVNAGEYITCSKVTGATSGLSGSAYIYYHRAE